ncbi:MAG TPA: hypothetical protein VKQ52_15230 [Puia sp.]|nr:hypothetical protein [Puia sp.]
MQKKHLSCCSLLALTALLLCNACSKSNRMANPSRASRSMNLVTPTRRFIPLTKDAFHLVQQAQRQGIGATAIERLLDSLAAVIPARRTVNSITTLDDPPGSDVPSTDELDGAAQDFGEAASFNDYETQQLVDQWAGDLPEDWMDLYNATNPSFSSVFNMQLTFPKRGNTVQVTVPYTFTAVLGAGAMYQLTGIGPSTFPPQLLPVGAGWGDVTQIDSYLNGLTNNMYVHADAQEKRTEIVSTGGTIEISANANAGIYQVGAKIGTNFTVQKAFNIYNQYTMDASLNAYIGVSFNVPYGAPSCQVWGTVTCVDTGILLNN